MPNTAKKEAIRKAYGELYEKLAPYIDENGWLKWTDECPVNPVISDYDYSHVNGGHRPKSLKGIENNNGWIRIESEEDLPLLEDKSEFWIANENGIFDFIASSLQVQRKWENKTLTHYQKVVKPEKPIY